MGLNDFIALVQRRIRYRISTRDTIRFRVTVSMIAAFFISAVIIFFAVPEFTFSLRSIALHHAQSDVAGGFAKMFQPLLDVHASISEERAAADFFNEVNPNTPIFLLDENGMILDWLSRTSPARRQFIEFEALEKRIKEGPSEFTKAQGAHVSPGHKNLMTPFSISKIQFASAVRVQAKPGSSAGRPSRDGYVYALLDASEFFARAQGVARENVMISQGAAMSIAAVLVPFLLVFLLIRNVMQRFRPIEEAMESFRAGKFETRVDVSHFDEFGTIGISLNTIAESIERSIANLRNAELYRKELVQTVVAALREPLDRIKQFAIRRRMQAFQGNAEELSVLRAFESSIDILESMLNELLQLSQLEAEDLAIHPEVVSIPEIVEDVAARFLPEAQAAGVMLLQDVQTNVTSIHADRLLLVRLLGNLVGNAIRYTPAFGVVQIRVSPLNGGVLIRVSDSGIGIPAENLPTIFNRYDRGAVRQDSPGGAGLGLAIAKRIVELHHGKIEVESEKGRGTTFQFSLFDTQPPSGE